MSEVIRCESIEDAKAVSAGSRCDVKGVGRFRLVGTAMGCEGCAFEYLRVLCHVAPCYGTARDDGISVIFKEERIMLKCIKCKKEISPYEAAEYGGLCCECAVNQLAAAQVVIVLAIFVGMLLLAFCHG